MLNEIKVKRIYDEPILEDGYRVLVDRLWPRGMTKEKAKIDIWAKELAPSTELRKWFHADINLYEEFSLKYLKELKENQNNIQKIIESANYPTITLLTAAKNVTEGHAVMLQCFLQSNFL